MFDVAPTELLMVGIVALLVIGPKDLPKAMRFVGKWIGKAQGVARQFRSGIDTMIRESELADMEKQWAAENERIMRDHPPAASLPAPQPLLEVDPAIEEPEPIMVEQPQVRPAGETLIPEPVKRKRAPRRKAPSTGDTLEATKPRKPRVKAPS
jgi:sec-independent protein translocase protein TatB